jgi:hypothetical protein
MVQFDLHDIHMMQWYFFFETDAIVLGTVQVSCYRRTMNYKMYQTIRRGSS